MNGFVIAVLSAAIVAILLIAVGKLKRGSWELVVAALLVGLAGYIWQSSSSLAGAPRAAAAKDIGFDEKMVTRRQELGERFGPEASWLTVADGFLRRGNTEEAVKTLNAGIKEYPQSSTLWVALANALVMHADGQLTPSADYAFARAKAIKPDGPAALFFHGLAYAQSGRFPEARVEWQRLDPMLASDGSVKKEVQDNLALLDQLIAAQDAQRSQPQ